MIPTVLIVTTKERRPRLNLCLDAVRDNAGCPHKILLYEGNDGGCVPAMHKAIEGLNGLIYFMNDDMIMQPKCLKLLMKNYNDNLCYPEDGINKGELATTWLCDAEFMRKYLHKGYSHNYSDTEMTEIAKMQGKLKFVPEAHIVHNHWTAGATKDETYTKNTQTMDKDRALFLDRKAHNFYL